MLYYIIGIISVIVFFLLGWFLSRKLSESKIVNAEKYAEKIIAEAEKEAETRKRESLLEVKEEWYKAKVKFEKETQQKKQELQKVEKRLLDKEVNLDRKVDLFTKREKDLEIQERETQAREKTLKAKDERLTAIIEEQNQKLENIAGLTQDEAKKLLMANLEEEARQDAAKLMKEIKDKAKETAEKEAKDIITLAIQRCAADHVVESTVSVVPLPNDEMKGRIIGREGRNIRAFEICTGIDVIVDDNPEAVVLSGFDTVRREIARISLERLITDGRIHPARIEEVVEKVRQDMEEIIREIGEQTVFDVGIHDMNQSLVKLLGRLRYRTSYGQNVLQHSKEVALISGLMASELELDTKIARRAGLLHDIGKAMDHQVEGTHTQIGLDLVKKYGENPIIQNAVAAHHNDIPYDSIVAVLVQAADAISSARPGARRETLESYIERLEKLEEIADSFTGVEKAFAIQAGREIRIIVKPEVIDDIQSDKLASEIARKIEEKLDFPGQIKVTVIREIRVIDYAK
jgi:ribonuclease Y